MASKIQDPTGYGLHSNQGAAHEVSGDLGPLFSLPTPERSEVPITSGTRTPALPPSHRIPQAIEVAAIASSGRRQKILQFLVTFGDSTLDELCKGFGLMQNQISGRISELKLECLIAETGQVRPSRSGCACMVYTITTRGREELSKIKQSYQSRANRR